MGKQSNEQKVKFMPLKYCYENEKLRSWCFAVTKAKKTQQCSKQTDIQIVVLLNTRANASIIENGKQVTKNTTTLHKAYNRQSKAGEWVNEVEGSNPGLKICQLIV